MKKILLFLIVLVIGVANTSAQKHVPLAKFKNDTLSYLRENFEENQPYKGRKFSAFLKNNELKIDSIKICSFHGELSGVDIYYYPRELWPDQVKRPFMSVFRFAPPLKNYDVIEPQVKNLSLKEKLDFFKDYEILGISIELTIGAW